MLFDVYSMTRFVYWHMSMGTGLNQLTVWTNIDDLKTVNMKTWTHFIHNVHSLGIIPLQIQRKDKIIP